MDNYAVFHFRVYVDSYPDVDRDIYKHVFCYCNANSQFHSDPDGGLDLDAYITVDARFHRYVCRREELRDDYEPLSESYCGRFGERDFDEFLSPIGEVVRRVFRVPQDRRRQCGSVEPDDPDVEFDGLQGPADRSWTLLHGFPSGGCEEKSGADFCFAMSWIREQS